MYQPIPRASPPGRKVVLVSVSTQTFDSGRKEESGGCQETWLAFLVKNRFFILIWIYLNNNLELWQHISFTFSIGKIHEKIKI
jgi:hypothetical protein